MNCANIVKEFKINIAPRAGPNNHVDKTAILKMRNQIDGEYILLHHHQLQCGGHTMTVRKVEEVEFVGIKRARSTSVDLDQHQQRRHYQHQHQQQQQHNIYRGRVPIRGVNNHSEHQQTILLESVTRNSQRVQMHTTSAVRSARTAALHQREFEKQQSDHQRMFPFFYLPVESVDDDSAHSQFPNRSEMRTDSNTDTTVNFVTAGSSTNFAANVSNSGNEKRSSTSNYAVTHTATNLCGSSNSTDSCGCRPTAQSGVVSLLDSDQSDTEVELIARRKRRSK